MSLPQFFVTLIPILLLVYISMLCYLRRRQTAPEVFTHDRQYLALMRHARDHGIDKSDRTGTGTRSVFGYQMRFDLTKGFPILTSKLVPFKTLFNELVWFLEGSTSNNRLREINGNSRPTIWEEWADPVTGELGPIYGYQWRSWPGELIYTAEDADLKGKVYCTYRPVNVKGTVHQPGIDQITNVINQIKNNPDSRRMIVSAWNPAQIDSMKLPPCHALFQFYTRKLTLAQRIAVADRYVPPHLASVFAVSNHSILTHELLDTAKVPSHYLDCQLYQRSADIFLGVPFNIASYAMLTHMIAQQCNMIAGEFVWTGGDCHLYSNHMEQVEEQLSRPLIQSPTLRARRVPDSIFDYTADDFELRDYFPHPAIKAAVAV